MSLRVLMAFVAAALVACGALLGVGRSAGDAERGQRLETGVGSRANAGPLPAPRGDVVLRVTGVERGNVGARTTKLDLETLDGIARERLTVHEPFVKRDVTFTGVSMDALLARLRVTSWARRLYLHALDDYHVELPMAAVAAEGLLATRMDGKPIKIADGGPIRLVFSSDRGLGANTDNWIWSVDSMRARR